ncbi:hypothetical protein CA13_00220 [Planctomycetes bacterium CA13]|uniref:Uncharacterized protein n=1 Tax=Novipirellula herctigrandis TaxID=2527986 RepID=A0A5C5YV54_9BACT|nr:hypothetical protein CA13_00220 [Planctomycetes bacterium CA13]
MRRTMRCNGAGLAWFYEWKVNLPGPLIAVVRRTGKSAPSHRYD